jgi:hypothetical protein
MKKCNKISHTCGTNTYAQCVITEGDVNTDSELFEVECTNLQENLDDIYNQLGNLDLSALGESCLTYVESEDGKNIVKNVLLKFEEKICELQEKVTALENRQLCDMLIGDCVDVACLTDACDNSITTFGELLQALVIKSCEETP